MGLFRFLKSLVIKPQKSDATLLADDIAREYALEESSKHGVAASVAEPEEAVEPIPSQMAPFMIEMIKGQSYNLCQCGQSKTAPFCDSSHEAEGCKHRPYVYKAKRTGYYSICGCMESYDYPICDGTHDLLL